MAADIPPPSVGEAFTGVFDRHAAAYRERLEDAMARGEAESRARVLELLTVRAGERVLDLGCGPGTLTAPLATAAGPEGLTLGVDLALGMLSHARAAAPPWARLVRMNMERLGLAGGAFDAVAAGHALAFCADLPAALAEVRRVLVPGGRLVASLPARVPGGQAPLERALEGLVPPPPALPALDGTLVRLSSEAAAKSALQEAGFRQVEATTVPEVSRYRGPEDLVDRAFTWWILAWRLEALSGQERVRVREIALERLRHTVGDGPLELPAASLVLFARR
ncbi:MAG TPA: methyltransferase domain-containing protein [Streptosporangiaceae bacterium]